MKIDEGSAPVTKSIQEDIVSIESESIALDSEGNPIIEDGGDLEGPDPADVLRQSIEESYTPPAAPKTEEDKISEESFTIGDETFFDGDADKLDELVRDPKAFNGLLNNIYKKAVAVGHDMAVKNFMKNTPEIVKTHVSQQIAIKSAVETFYSENQDLLPFKMTVGAFAKKIATERPDLSLPKVLDAAEKFARKKLNLPKDVEGEKSNKGKEPRFPKTPKGPRGAPKGEEKGIAKEIDDMLNAL